MVTGASSGIGAATARRLGADGWHVVLMARGAAKLDEVAHEVEKAGGLARPLPVDAGDPAAVRATAPKVREVGVPRAVINSAGAGVWRRLDETTPEEAQVMLAAPFLAAFHVTHTFLGDMIKAGRGALIHVGSPASRLPWPGATGYTATRWALRGLHEALAQDLRGTGVASIHTVFGKVTSEYFERNPDSEAYLPGLGKLIRVISPDECADVIADALDAPSSGEIVHPFMLRLFYLTERFFPGLVRWLTHETTPARPPAS